MFWKITFNDPASFKFSFSMGVLLMGWGQFWFFHQEAMMIVIREDCWVFKCFLFQPLVIPSCLNQEENARLQWDRRCFNGVRWRAPTRDRLSSRWHLLIRLSDLKVCPVWVIVSERGFMMEELHDVQLTEIKPLLTGQVSSPGGTATCCLLRKSKPADIMMTSALCYTVNCTERISLCF